MNDNTPPNGTPPEAPSLPNAGLLRLLDVLELMPISRSTLHARQAKGLYPRPVAMGQRARACRVEDTCALIKKGIA